MKANEFLRDNGIVKCSRIVEDLSEQGVDSDFTKDLKRLVESHELIERVGGLSLTKDFYEKFECVHIGLNIIEWRKLGRAIKDVESCL